MDRVRGFRAIRAFRIPRALLMLSGILMGTIGSCSLPTIKPPSL
jgi:hypothetical protein